MNKLLRSIAVTLLLCLTFSACMSQSYTGYQTSMLRGNTTAPRPVSTSEPLEKYGWLTQTEYDALMAHKKDFESLNEQQKILTKELGMVPCPNFTHTLWELSIHQKFVDTVGRTKYVKWYDERKSQGQCTSIYDFAENFNMNYDDIAGIIKEHSLDDFYPLEQLKLRFEYLSSKPAPAASIQAENKQESSSTADLNSEIQALHDSMKYDPSLHEIQLTVPQIPNGKLLYLEFTGEYAAEGISNSSWRAMEEETALFYWISGDVLTVPVSSQPLKSLTVYAATVDAAHPQPPENCAAIEISQDGSITAKMVKRG